MWKVLSCYDDQKNGRKRNGCTGGTKQRRVKRSTFTATPALPPSLSRSLFQEMQRRRRQQQQQQHAHAHRRVVVRDYLLNWPLGDPYGDGAEANTKTLGPSSRPTTVPGMLRTAPDRETFGARTATSVLIGGFADKDRHLLFVHSL